MFGYVRISKGELKVKEYEMYKAIYCSLCRKLGKSYGILSRLTLSYDFTFLALLNMSLTDGCDPIEQKRCTFNPLKKCIYCKNDDQLDMPSAAAMIMLYYKILDNINDEKGFKKIGFWILKPIFSSAHKKAKMAYPNIEKIISDFISEQKIIEQNNSDSLDNAADPTAKALSLILPLCSESVSEKRILERIGYCIGRYIYTIDAACDLEEDIKKNSYNPLKSEFKDKPKDYLKEQISRQIYFCINESAAAFELLNVKKYKPILDNIIYLGLEDTFIKELNK